MTDSGTHEPPRRPRRRLRWMLGGVAGFLAVALIAGAVILQPWLVFVNTEIDDDIPVVAGGPVATGPASPGPASPGTAAPDGGGQGPVLLAAGSLISHEHSTSGRVSVIRKPDGTRVLAIEDLDTTTGPDVHVWLSGAPVVEGIAGWRTAAGADHVDLGQIKGNRGDQVYEVPADVDLGEHPSVFLWCVKFGVSFGAAELDAA